MSMNLKMKIGNNQIISITPSKGTNTITFTQNQLDAIYRLYENNSSLTATFTVMTDNNSNYLRLYSSLSQA